MKKKIKLNFAMLERDLEMISEKEQDITLGGSNGFGPKMEIDSHGRMY